MNVKFSITLDCFNKNIEINRHFINFIFHLMGTWQLVESIMVRSSCRIRS